MELAHLYLNPTRRASSLENSYTIYYYVTIMASISRNAKNLDSEDAFVNVMFQEQRNDEAVISKGNDSFYEQFVDKGKSLIWLVQAHNLI